MYLEEKVEELEERIGEQDDTINMLKTMMRKLIDGKVIEVKTYSKRCGIWNHEIDDYCDGEVEVTDLDTESHICPKCGKDIDDDIYMSRMYEV